MNVRNVVVLKIVVRKKNLLSGLSTFIFLLAISFLAGSATYLYYGLNDRSQDLRLLHEGPHAIGTIAEKIDSSDEDEVKYEFVYIFKAGTGELFTTRQVIPYEWLYQKYAVEDQLDIVYEPFNPSHNFPSESGVRPLWHIVFWFIFLLCLGVVYLVVWLNKIVRVTRHKTTMPRLDILFDDWLYEFIAIDHDDS